MEIDAIIKLIEADEEIRKNINDVFEKQEHIKQEVEDEKKRLTEQAEANTKNIIEKIQSDLETKLKRKTDYLTSYREKAEADLQERYDKNHDKWRAEMVKRIISAKD